MPELVTVVQGLADRRLAQFVFTGSSPRTPRRFGIGTKVTAGPRQELPLCLARMSHRVA